MNTKERGDNLERGIPSQPGILVNIRDIMELDSKYVMHTYGRFPIAPIKGEGTRVWDTDGKAYLDFLSGIAVCSVGHCHPKVVAAIQEQASQLIHISNIFHIQNQAELAEFLVEHSCLDKVFFCNSGAEANEAAIKLARRYSRNVLGKERYEIITAERSFHGRTLTTVTATGQNKYQKGFEPLPSGFLYVPLNDIDALKKVISHRTCAIMLELIQGEGGVNPCEEEYLKAVRALCDENDIVLIFDEVQTGLGRTGKLFTYEHYNVEPDIMTLAKALGGGVPIGAMLAKDNIAKGFEPGSHGSTFGGNPLSCAAGLAAMRVIVEEDLPKKAHESGIYFMSKLEELKGKYPFIKESRGKGLMIGVELDIKDESIGKRAMERGLLLNCIGGKIIRFLPPLNVTRDEIDEAIMILDEVLASSSDTSEPETSIKTISSSLKGRDLLTLHDFSSEEIEKIIDVAEFLKRAQKAGRSHPILAGKTLGMVFSKASTRTRVSFEVGILQLGGHALNLSPTDMQLSRGETIADTARILSRFVDGIMIRTYAHSDVEELAKYATIPVINGLTDLYHPCQVLGDLLTIKEKKGALKGLTLLYIGDGNNVAHSLMLGCAKMGMNVYINTPSGYEPSGEVVKLATADAKEAGGSIILSSHPFTGLEDADVIYTDVWTSMGQEKEREERMRVFPPYQVNQEFLSRAKKDVIVMHCLPAHRGEEITDEVMDGPNSVVFDEAENRLHAQKAVIALLMSD